MMTILATLGLVTAFGLAIFAGTVDGRRWLRRYLTPEGRAVGRRLRGVERMPARYPIDEDVIRQLRERIRRKSDHPVLTPSQLTDEQAARLKREWDKMQRAVRAVRALKAEQRR